MLSCNDKHVTCTDKSEQIYTVMLSEPLLYYINLYNWLFHTTCDRANIETTLRKLLKIIQHSSLPLLIRYTEKKDGTTKWSNGDCFLI